MRFVLANHSFEGAGGTETYLLTLGEHLQRLGHEVVIFAHELGRFSDHGLERGVQSVSQPSALPEACDVVFTQDAIVAYELAERYPDALHLFRTCSDVYDFELPPQLDDVVDLVVVVSERYARLVRGCAVSAPIVRLRAPIDIDRLAPRGPIRAEPTRAVLLGNYSDRHELVKRVWEAEGLEVIDVGRASQRFDVADALADADIVVAKSRAALDAMACARAVYVYDRFGGDGWVTPEMYPLMEADNFAGQATTRVITADDLVRDLGLYSRDMGAVNRDLVVQHHSARDHALDLIAAISQRRPRPRVSAPHRELARLTALQWSWHQLARTWQRENHQLRERLKHAIEAAHAARDDLKRTEARANERQADLRRRLEHANEAARGARASVERGEAE